MQQGLYSVNQATGGVTQVGRPGRFERHEVIIDLAWNPVNHRLTAWPRRLPEARRPGLSTLMFIVALPRRFVPVNSLVNVLHVGLTCRPSGEPIFLDVHNGFVSHLVDGDAIWLGTNLTFHRVQPGIRHGLLHRKDLVHRVPDRQPCRHRRSSLRTINPKRGLHVLANMPGGSNTIYTDAAVQLVVFSPADFNSDLCPGQRFVVFAGQYERV